MGGFDDFLLLVLVSGLVFQRPDADYFSTPLWCFSYVLIQILVWLTASVVTKVIYSDFMTTFYQINGHRLLFSYF